MHLALLRGRAGIITACLFGFGESWALLCLHILRQQRVHMFARTRMYCQDKHGLLLDAISIGELCASANCVTTRNCVYQQALATTSMQQHRWQWMRLSATSPSAQTRRAGVPCVLLLFYSRECAWVRHSHLHRQNGPECHAFCCLTGGNVVGAAG